MRVKKFSLIMATVLGCAVGAPFAVAGCAGLVVGAYTQTDWSGTTNYICISNANYDAASNNGFVNGSCPPNSFPLMVSRYGSASSGGGNCCFAKGTPILIAANKYVPIEEICVGDNIISLNLSSRTQEESQVLAVIKKRRVLYKITFKGPVDPIYVTDDHPLWMGENSWGSINPESSALAYSEYGLSFNQLTKGGEILNSRSEIVVIDNISKLYPSVEAEVYTLTVDHNDHNYLVGKNNIVAHNACCFAAGSLVLSADNSLRPIESLVAGDSVLVMNLTNGLLEPALVSETIKGNGLIHTIQFDDGSFERFTDSHPIWDGEKWLSIAPEKSLAIYQNYNLPHGELKIGATLVNADNKKISVLSITPWQHDSVYSICVEHESHNFIVGAAKIIAHNKRGGG